MKPLAVLSFPVMFPTLLVFSFVLLFTAVCLKSEPVMQQSSESFNAYSAWFLRVMG